MSALQQPLNERAVVAPCARARATSVDQRYGHRARPTRTDDAAAKCAEGTTNEVARILAARGLPRRQRSIKCERPRADAR